MTDITAVGEADLDKLYLTMKEQPSTLHECKVRHFFSNGQYCREMLIPAGTLIMGKLHRHGHLNVITVGHVKVFANGEVTEMRGPFAFESTPGTQRVVLALEDTVWTTYHENPSDTRDLQQLEAEIIEPSYEQLGEPNDMGLSSGGGRLGNLGQCLSIGSEQEREGSGAREPQDGTQSA